MLNDGSGFKKVYLATGEDGFLLLYKRIENGNFRWPRTKEEAREITIDQYQMLMQGLEMVVRHPIEEITDPGFSL